MSEVKGPHAEQNAKGTIALRDLLRVIVNEPSLFADDNELLHALKSQGRTAGLDYEFKDSSGKRSTQPMSLNTLKLYANKILERGFEGFEALRIGAIDAINSYKERSQSANKRTKAGLIKMVAELEDELDKHRKINFILLQGIQSAIISINSIKNAPEKKIQDKRADDAMIKIRAIVAMNPPPFDTFQDQPKVADLTAYRDGDE